MDNETMNFSEALEWLKQGKKITRQGWNIQGFFIELQRPTENSYITLPYLYRVMVEEIDNGLETEVLVERIPWQPNHIDLLANDWVCIP